MLSFDIGFIKNLYHTVNTVNMFPGKKNYDIMHNKLIREMAKDQFLINNDETQSFNKALFTFC